MSESDESKIVSGLSYRAKIKRFYVTLQSGVRIWTWKVSNEPTHPNKPPIVLIHGTCAASVIWLKNFEELSKSRIVYAIDYGWSIYFNLKKFSKV
jgi:pimeloyl-ACP methyl ester carboxylesterase